MLLRLAVSGRLFLMRSASGMVFVELLGAIGPFEFMALAGNAEHANSHN